MGSGILPYQPYHPHLGYTLALTCGAWFVIYLYNRYALTNHPRMRVILVGLAISLPLFAELGSYAIFWLRPGTDTGVGRVLSYTHMHYVEPLQIDLFLAPWVLWSITAIMGTLMLVSLLRFIYGSYQLHQSLKIATPLSTTEHAHLQAHFAQIATEHGISIPPVEVLPLQAPLAFTTGMIHPRIYISETLIELLNVDETMAVFCHELAHIYRHDNMWNGAIRLLRDVSWFMPFSHIGWQWMVKSQDEDCDAMAVRLTHEPLALARALVKVASAWSKTDLPPLVDVTAFAAVHDHITTRVEQMLALAAAPRYAGRRALAGAYAIAGTFLLLAVLPALLGS